MKEIYAKVEFDCEKINALMHELNDLVEECGNIVHDIENLSQGWESSWSKAALKWDEENSEESSSDDANASQDTRL